MIQHKTINDLIDIGRMRKRRRLDLQRDNYKYHTDLVMNMFESFTSTAYDLSTAEDVDEFQCNNPIGMLHNNRSRAGALSIANLHQHLHKEYVQNANHKTLLTLESTINGQKLAVNNISSYLNTDNGKT